MLELFKTAMAPTKVTFLLPTKFVFLFFLLVPMLTYVFMYVLLGFQCKLDSSCGFLCWNYNIR